MRPPKNTFAKSNADLSLTMKVNAISMLLCAAVGLVQGGLFGTTPLQDLKSALDGIDGTIGRWGGGILTLVPIAVQAEVLATRIKETQKSFQKLGARSAETDEPLLRDGNAALQSLNHAMNTITSSAAKFQKVPMGVPIMYGILKSFQISTDRMIQTGIDGASPDAKPQLEVMQGQAKEYFAKALESFEQQFS